MTVMELPRYSTLSQTEYYRLLGENLRAAREARGWSQVRLADEIEYMSGAAVSLWESAIRHPDAWTVDRLEKLFGRRIRP